MDFERLGFTVGHFYDNLLLSRCFVVIVLSSFCSWTDLVLIHLSRSMKVKGSKKYGQCAFPLGFPNFAVSFKCSVGKLIITANAKKRRLFGGL